MGITMKVKKKLTTSRIPIHCNLQREKQRQACLL